MQSAKVDGAFIIQPGNHLYDHSYVTSVLRAHPDKFVGALLANPTSVRSMAQCVCLAQDEAASVLSLLRAQKPRYSLQPAFSVFSRRSRIVCGCCR